MSGPRELAAATPRPSIAPPLGAAPPPGPDGVDAVAYGGPALTLVLAACALLLLTGAEGDIPAGLAAVVSALGSIGATLVAMRSQLRREREGTQAAAYAALDGVIGTLHRQIAALGTQLSSALEASEAAREETQAAREEAAAAARETEALRAQLERTEEGLQRAEARLERYGRAVAELQEHERARIDAAVASTTPSSGVDARAGLLVSLDDSSPGAGRR